MSYRAESRYLINNECIELVTERSRSEIITVNISTPLNHHNTKKYNEKYFKQTI